MATEYQILQERDVFEIVPRPERRNVVGSKWVYAIKWKEDRTLEQRKVRMVIPKL